MTYRHDVDSVADYSVDWTDCLATGEAIASAVWQADAPIAVVGSSIAGLVATAILSGGQRGKSHAVRCRITTSLGRVHDQTITLQGVQR